MFNPKTEKIEKLAKIFPKVIEELKSIFKGPSNVYIDWQNVIHWQDKLKWHFDIKRMKQFFDSFDDIKSVKIYTGTLEGDKKSKKQIQRLENMKYDVCTKPVKLIKIPIDVSSIPSDSTAIIKNFIKKSFLSKLDIETIEYLNKKISILNKQRILFIEEPKCNFDVEIGREIQKDFESNKIDNYILWSTDSDFANPIKHISNNGKQAIIFATSRKVSKELGSTNIFIFDVKKIKEFICWKKEIPQNIKEKLNSL